MAFRLLMGLSVVLCSREAFALVLNCSWSAGPGNWESAFNWNCGDVPNNDLFTNQYNVSIGDIAKVDGVRLRSAESIFHLAVVTGSRLYLTNGANLFIANFPNANTGYPEQELEIGGDIVFNQATNSSAQLSLSKGDMTLRGFAGMGGTIWLTNYPGSVIGGDTANTNFDTRLLMIEGTTIRGSGEIRSMALNLNHDCSVRADNGDTLLWQPRTAYYSSTNDGFLTAAGSNSVLVLDGDPYGHVLYNRFGQISAIGHGVVEIGMTIVGGGGDLFTSGGGRIRGGGKLQNVTLDPGSQFDVTGTLDWAGAITNQGAFTVAGGHAIVADASPVTLAGGGSVLLATNGPAVSEILLSRGSLRNVDNLIHGEGHLEATGTGGVLDNQGRIEADTPGDEFQHNLWLRNEGSGLTWTNSGTLRAVNGGVMLIGGAPIANTNGFIVAESNSTVRVLGAKIHNGTVSANNRNALVRLEGAELQDLLITTTNQGLVAVADLGSSVNATIDQILNRGDIVVSNGCTLFLSGDVTNEGRIFVDPTAIKPTSISLKSDVTLSGNGGIELDEPGALLTSLVGPRRLVNDGNTIRGAGRIQGVWLENQGTVQADTAAPLYYTAPVFGSWTNSGALRATGTGGLEVTDPLLVNLGTVEIAPDSHIGLSTGGGIRQDAGELIVDGAISNQLTAGSVLLNAGMLRGSGIIIGDVTNADGIVAPGSPAGKLSIDGAFTQQAGGSLNIEISGTTPGVDYDQLAVSSSASLAGTLAVTFVDGFAPSVGDTFEILRAGSQNGAFDALTGLVSSNGLVLLPRYTATNVVLVATTSITLNQPVRTANAFGFGFPTVSGVVYQVEYTDSLNPPISWQNLDDPWVGTGMFQLITNTPLTSEQRFYRVRQK